jgi:hypothetical protein
MTDLDAALEAAARKLADYEEGNLSPDQVIELFQQLVDSGLAWELSGHYQGVASRFIEQGLVRRGNPATDTEAP